MSRGKKRTILMAGTIIMVASIIVVLFAVNGNASNSILVVAETEKTSYHFGETVNITLRTVISDAGFSVNKTGGMWVARIPDNVNPEKIIGNQRGLAEMIVSLDPLHGGYKCHLPVSNFSTSSNLSLVWNGTVDGPLDPADGQSLSPNMTYMAPAGYYLVYGLREYPSPNVFLDYECNVHSIFHLDGIKPKVNWTCDNSTQEVNFGVNVISTFEDSPVNCSLRAAANVYNGNNSFAFLNESALLLPLQNESFSFTVENASLRERIDYVILTAIIDTDKGRFSVCCLASWYESQEDWAIYGA